MNDDGLAADRKPDLYAGGAAKDVIGGRGVVSIGVLVQWVVRLHGGGCLSEGAFWHRGFWHRGQRER
jgi:hypothetical protein